MPLAGKTVDLLWLAEQGYSVLAVELVELAVKAFFDEHRLPHEVTGSGPLKRYRAQDRAITVYQGDVFALGAEELDEVDWVHDRAAVVALPAEMRARYGAHLSAVLPSRAELLVTTFEYEQSRMDGPPFSVPLAEVEQVFSAFRFDHLRTRDLEVLARLEGGVIAEHVYRGRRQKEPER
ncbi:MAG: thiopurine S-methyltransferase [Myxococcota bacterium]